MFLLGAMEQDGPRYVVDRPTYNIADFDRDFDRKDRQFPVGEKVKELFRYKILLSIHATITWKVCELQLIIFKPALWQKSSVETRVDVNDLLTTADANQASLLILLDLILLITVYS